MDSDEEAALTAIIIATFRENIKHKKGGWERNVKSWKSIFAWHRRTLRNYILGHIKDDTLKEDTHLKELIHPEFKLALTTGFIASGNSY